MTDSTPHTEYSIANALSEGVEQLESISESPRLDAELLLMRAIDVPRSYLIAHPEDSLDPAAWERYSTAVDDRRRGKPIAYITGEKEFWSLTLMVSPATLVPRPDTELLVEQAISCISRRDATRVLDLGTGSGAVALAMARERPLAEITATDISPDALAIARENARQLDLDNVRFELGDWLEPVRDQQFDIVVSNPPYIRDNDPALESLGFEPREALASGADGLDAIRCIAVDASAAVVPNGWLMLEHGAEQGALVAEILAAAGWEDIRTIADLAGLDRVTVGRAHGA